ncbi:MAG TPA: response regulator, partial [Thermomicrobiales bacterium]|nr:response regulator [Thermomicrobiales bacterium]
ALATLKSDHGIALVVVDVNTPNAAAGLDFIRAVRRRWVETPLVAITEHADDLAPLHGTPEWPILVVSKPYVPHQMRQAIDMALAAATAG